ncbi:MAG: glycoside hydrolase family 43 C-terminal domain-containing protein [Marinilabilia sp.]
MEQADIPGKYEVITLQYEYQVMQESELLVLTDDGSVSGAMSGEWSYDENTCILSLAENDVIVKKGWDWEANPRETTVIFSGLNNEGISLWGK